MSAKEEFIAQWKKEFPSEDTPSEPKFFESIDDDPETYRKSLQEALDSQNRRVEELKKQLSREQFVMEFIAQEIEKLPVPRYVIGDGKSVVGKHPPAIAAKPLPPKPMPRGSPKLSSKKPNPPPRGPSSPTRQPSDDNGKDVNVLLRRNKSTPPLHSPGRIPVGEHTSRHTVTFAESISNSTPSVKAPEGPIESTDHTQEEVLEAVNDVGDLTTVESQSENMTDKKEENAEKSDSRLVVKRESMKRVKMFNVDEEVDLLSPAASEYMAIWPKTSSKPGDLMPSDAAVPSGGEGLEKAESVDDSSAASMSSSILKPGGSKRHAHLVKVDYSSSKKAPVAIKDESNNSESSHEVDSDLEDDKPQYVRLMYKAYSTVPVIKGLKKTDDTSSNEGDSLDGPSGNHASTETQPRAYELDRRESIQGSAAMDEAIVTSDGDNVRMRNWMVNNILQSEASYIEDLDVLLRYKKSLNAAADSSKPMITMPDIELIFGNLDAIYTLHAKFKKDLQPIVAEWNEHSRVAHLFKDMVEKLQVYQTYLENYPKSIATVKRCCLENPDFDVLVKEIKCPSSTDKQHLEEILHKPINRMQRNSLVLHDFIKCTPANHPDYPVLKSALESSQSFLVNIRISSNGAAEKPLHVLVKNQLLVEYVGEKARKLRHVFLFNDLLVCTQSKINKAKIQYEVKWFIPLSELELSDKMDDTPVEWKQKVDKAEKEIHGMKERVKSLKAELRKEFRSFKEKNLDASDNPKIQRLTRKIQDEEGNLLLAEPRLRFAVSKKGTKYMFLLPSDYQRREWQGSIKALQAKLPTSSQKITALDVRGLIDSCKDSVQINSVGEMVMKEANDEDICSGQLTITIHKMQGLQEACDTFTAIEVDSFGHFYLKARTKIMTNTKIPTWNQTFEIDLEAASTLRLICYKHTQSGDTLLGKSALDLSKRWLKQGFNENVLSMDEVTLTISIKYKTAEQTIRRIPSKVDTGLFGVALQTTCHHEGNRVPAFVTACIKAVEERGLDEMGIYRVSGTTTDIQRIRKAFDKSAKVGITLLSEVDINAITGALKLYFRELPEALFTDKLYPQLIEAYSKTDKEDKEKQMLALVDSLPEPNYFTAMAILNHLVTVGSHESSNKMPFHNLAVVFGPTLLKPAVKGVTQNSLDLFSSGANDAMYQSGILFNYLTLVQKGIALRSC